MNDLNLFLKKFNIEYEFIDHEKSGKTTNQAEEALSVDASKILKSLLFKSKKGNYVGVIIPGDKRINIKKIENYFKEKKVQGYNKLTMAKEEEVKSFLGYEIGGVSPFAFHERCFTFYDSSLLKKDFVIGAGGTPFRGLKFNPREFSKFNFISLDIIC